MKRGVLCVAVLAAFSFGLMQNVLSAADKVVPQNDTPVSGGGVSDPFAELLREQPVQVIKTGPSCEFVKVQLPPGVTLDDIPGLGAP